MKVVDCNFEATMESVLLAAIQQFEDQAIYVCECVCMCEIKGFGRVIAMDRSPPVLESCLHPPLPSWLPVPSGL